MNLTKPGARGPTNLLPADPKLRAMEASPAYNESFLISVRPFPSLLHRLLFMLTPVPLPSGPAVRRDLRLTR